MIYIIKQSVRGAASYFIRTNKGRETLSCDQAEAMVADGAATITTMRPGNHKTGPKNNSLLLPKRYKTAVMALDAIAEMQRVSSFARESLTLEVVRCVGTLPDENEWILGGKYNWRIRRSLKD